MESLGSFPECHVGGGVKRGKPVGASGNVDFFFSQATSFEICFDQDQTLSGCQRGSTHVDSKSISLGMILAS